MASGEVRVEHVSDTALIVAAARARETARPDGVLRDPFAERLAGARGMALLGKLGANDWLGVAVVGLRARTIDEMLLATVAAHGIRTVVLLGAGLDARAWRLDLPHDLRWIEIDFAPILDYKDRILVSEKPRCRRERMSADLTVASERQAVWAAAGSDSAIIITEGLLLYLPARITEALATEPSRQSGIRHWLLDIAPSALMRYAHQDHMEEIEKVRAPDRAEGQQILDLAERSGCRRLAWRNYTREGFAMAGARGMSVTPAMIAEATAHDPSGIYLYRMPDVA